MIHFAWPWMIIMVILPWVARRLLPPATTQSAAALRVPFFEILFGFTAKQNQQTSAKYRWLVLNLLWGLIIVAAARPQWLGETIGLPVTGRDLLLAVDISGSMDTRDFELNGQQLSRLEVVKAIGSSFIDRRNGDRVGLILFGTQAYLHTPLTFDRETVKQMLLESTIGLAGKETAIGDAIGIAVKRLKEQQVKTKVLILLTDGANTAGEFSPKNAAILAKMEGLKIYTIGIGADRIRVNTLLGTQIVNPSAGLDESTLKAIADATGGAFYRAKDSRELEEIYEELNKLEPTAKDTEYFRIRQELFFWPLTVVMLISMGYAFYLIYLFQPRIVGGKL